MVPLQLSVVETVKFAGSIDLLNVMEIVFLTETSVAPSAEETAETVGAEVSAVAILPLHLRLEKNRKIQEQ